MSVRALPHYRNDVRRKIKRASIAADMAPLVLHTALAHSLQVELPGTVVGYVKRLLVLWELLRPMLFGFGPFLLVICALILSWVIIGFSSNLLFI